jgi:phosphoribosylformylglycinamidine synthase
MLKQKPNILVLRADGINRDEELKYAFTIAGGNAAIVHINDLREKKVSLKNFQILAFPGGFAYGDDIVSGKILANELTSFLIEELGKFVERKDTITFGVCNGFQVLVRTGLLPFGRIGNMDITLTNNNSHFESRWVPLTFEKKSRCVFLGDLAETQVMYPVAHGEGKFFTDEKTIKTIEDQNMVVLRYCDETGKPTQQYPQNPNGSTNAIAGICDTTGRVFGLMPHAECFTRIEQHPNWRRIKNLKPQGLPLFQNMVNYVKNS